MKVIRLAWRYICFHRLKTVLMVACISLTVALPIGIHLLLQQFNREIVARSNRTPLVIGAKGSRLDLTLSALYLQKKCEEQITFGEVARVVETGYAQAIPLYLGYSAQSHPIVGTSLDYFELRRLTLAEGHLFRRLGDCVIGSGVAEKQQLKVGDYLLSDRAMFLDIAGNPPLYMRVTGILEPKRTPDDEAVFVDLKTAWVLDGLGHGHEDLSDVDDQTKILDRQGKTTIASAGVRGEMRITDENINSFHFHGDPADFPITAVIAVPPDQRSRDLLTGRYQSAAASAQIVEPASVVRDLMALVFRAKQFFDANSLIISFATFLLLIMVVILSLKLREREMETMFKIGCSKATIAKLQVAELGIIAAASAVVIAILVAIIALTASQIVQSLLIQG